MQVFARTFRCEVNCEMSNSTSQRWRGAACPQHCRTPAILGSSCENRMKSAKRNQASQRASLDKIHAHPKRIVVYRRRIPGLALHKLCGNSFSPSCIFSPAVTVQVALQAVPQHRVDSTRRLRPFECRIEVLRARRYTPGSDPAAREELCPLAHPSVTVSGG